MLVTQDDACAVCRKAWGSFGPMIDHCHKTGRVRGLLCRACNVSIGTLGDDHEGVRRALAYLETH
jgi:hypothetical protein